MGSLTLYLFLSRVNRYLFSVSFFLVFLRTKHEDNIRGWFPKHSTAEQPSQLLCNDPNSVRVACNLHWHSTGRKGVTVESRLRFLVFPQPHGDNIADCHDQPWPGVGATCIHHAAWLIQGPNHHTFPLQQRRFMIDKLARCKKHDGGKTGVTGERGRHNQGNVLIPWGCGCAWEGYLRPRTSQSLVDKIRMPSSASM